VSIRQQLAEIKRLVVARRTVSGLTIDQVAGDLFLMASSIMPSDPGAQEARQARRAEIVATIAGSPGLTPAEIIAL
jgi:hypothetical protein